jgi:hypothetical protein
MPLLLSRNCWSLSSKRRNGREVTAIPVRVTKWRRKPTFFTSLARAPDYLCERKRLQPKTSHLTFTLRQFWNALYLPSNPPYTDMILPVNLNVFLVRGVSYHTKYLGKHNRRYSTTDIMWVTKWRRKNHFDVTNRTVRSLPRRNCGHSVKRA